MPSSSSALNPIDPPVPLIDAIRHAQTILLITHLAPDSDAIGSLLGLTHALRSIGKSIVPSCADQIFDRFNLLPGSQDIVQQTSGSFELIIALDCADASRMGNIWAKLNDPKMPLINIDHHITNTQFGSINWVDPQATATSEIILTLIDQLNIQVTREISTCLLYGIVGDTLGFRTPHTTPRSLEYSMRLMQAGAVLSEIMEQQFNRRSLALIKLWGKALNNLQIKDRIAFTTISKAMRTSVSMSGSSDISLSSFLISANEADRAAVLVETDDGQIDLSLRAKSGHDVAKAALALGGGGHPLAAGATIDGPMDVAVKRVIEALKANAA
ncbi:MAG TPA: bifunctional oligoribonuclease/PAP phosphatase NrnA [Anaerolineae bacterium]|nr:bifunctional oligoribonuclease/PAP phosphatase NrnA [Anaerolineae bacterium]